MNAQATLEPSDLETQLRQTLAELELCSVTSAASLQASGRDTSDDIGGRRPPGDNHPPQDHYRHEWERLGREQEAAQLEGLPTIRFDRYRQELLERAREELASIRKQQKHVEIQAETDVALSKRIVREGDGFSVREVALALRVTETRVRRAVVELGADLSTGRIRRMVVAQAADGDAHEHARRLAASGMTERQIRMVTGLPKTAVRLILGRAA